MKNRLPLLLLLKLPLLQKEEPLLSPSSREDLKNNRSTNKITMMSHPWAAKDADKILRRDAVVPRRTTTTPREEATTTLREEATTTLRDREVASECIYHIKQYKYLDQV
jgi:hypothetical protein